MIYQLRRIKMLDGLRSIGVPCSARSNSPFGQNIRTWFAHKSTQGGQSLSYWLIYTILLTCMHVMAVITLHIFQGIYK